jgi:Uma2 family endonuclease
MNDWMPRHRITVDEYYRMAEVGLLSPDARVELIEGEIIDMPPIGSRHGGTVMQLVRLLSSAVRDLAHVSAQSAVRLSNSSEPQPDLALVKPRADFYKHAHPCAADTFLIIEVSETTLRYDRKIKVPLYARHGVPEVWIVDLRGRQIHFFRSPAGGEYTDVSSTSEPAVATPSALAGIQIDLSHVLDE